MTRGHWWPFRRRSAGVPVGGTVRRLAGSGSGIASAPGRLQPRGVRRHRSVHDPPATAPNPAYAEAHGHANHRGSCCTTTTIRRRATTATRSASGGWTANRHGQYNCAPTTISSPARRCGGAACDSQVIEDDTSRARGSRWRPSMGSSSTGNCRPRRRGTRAGSDPDGSSTRGTAIRATGRTPAAGYEDGKCCHGQPDRCWGATGAPRTIACRMVALRPAR